MIYLATLALLLVAVVANVITMILNIRNIKRLRRISDERMRELDTLMNDIAFIKIVQHLEDEEED